MIADEVSDAVQFIGLRRLSIGLITVISWVILLSVINVLLNDLEIKHPFSFFAISLTILTIVILSVVLSMRLEHTQVAETDRIRILPEYRARREYRLKILSSQEELKATHFITDKIFHDRHPDFKWVNSLYGNCTRPMTVLLLKKHTDKKSARNDPHQLTRIRGNTVIGFASAWALTDDAGIRMSQGNLDEEQLCISDMSDSNAACNYIYVPAIADLEALTLDSSSKRKSCAAVRSSSILKIGLLDLLIDYFFIDDRPRNLIMDGWSPEGINEIEKLSKFLCSLESESKDSVSHKIENDKNEAIVTCKTSVVALRAARLALLRRFAGVQNSIRGYDDAI